MINELLVKRVIFSVLAVLFFQMFGMSVWAQYPTKPITLIIGHSAGGVGDLTGRALADGASKTLGQPIVVMNKPGAGGSIGVSLVKNAKPDGYTIGNLTTGGIFAQYIRKPPYDINGDFTPIIRYGDFYYGVVVRADSPWKTFKELVDYAKANPGKIKYSTSGPGTVHHLAMEKLAKQEGFKWVHIPSPGCHPGITALLGGHVDVSACDTVWKPHVDSGRLRLIAIHGPTRMPKYPDVPTWIDLGYKISITSFIGFLGPKGIPQPIQDKLHQAFKEAMETPEFKKTLDNFDMIPVYRNPEGMAKDIKDLCDEWGKVIVDLGLREE